MGRGIGSSLITSGIPSPIMPTENIGMMSGAIRNKKGRHEDKRGSRRRDQKADHGRPIGGSRRRDGRGIAGLAQVTMKDPKTGRLYGGLVKDGVPQFKKPDFVSDQDFNKSFPKPDINLDFYTRQSSPIYDGRGNVIGYRDGSKGTTEMFDKPIPREEYKGPGHSMGQPKETFRDAPDQPRFDPSKPSAVQETTRVNVQDPTLGGPPEREVPLPKEKDMTPRGPAPFAPNEGDVAKQRFFETMFERAANRKERSGIDREEMMDRQKARRDEAAMRDSERGRGMKGRRMRRRDFTRRRPERRRSREERAAFRDRYVSTLGSNFFS